MSALFILLIALLTACNPTTNLNVIGNVYRPISTENCEQFGNNVAAILGAKTSVAIRPFKNAATDEEGEACVIQTNGTGLQFASLIDVTRLLRSGLFSTWEEMRSYQADGPTGTATAFRHDRRLAVVNVNWDPAPEAKCPKDQVISNCPLTPEQKLYTITIQAMQK